MEASQKRPDLLLLSTRLAAIWIRQGRFDEAEGMYRRLLASHPENTESLNNLAWLLIDLSGKSPSLLDTRAVVLIRSGNVAQAAMELKDARSVDQRNPNLPLHLAWANQAEQKYAQAIEAFDQAVKLGWKAEQSDPLERAFIDKLRREIGR
jgi:Tfp pilus assembly protein PilF